MAKANGLLSALLQAASRVKAKAARSPTVPSPCRRSSSGLRTRCRTCGQVGSRECRSRAPSQTAASSFSVAAGEKTDPAPFIGVTTQGSQGIVDTAAQEGLVGRSALLRLLDVLRKHGLRGHWNGKVTEARGIGGRAKSLGTVEVPVGLGGASGVLELTVRASASWQSKHTMRYGLSLVGASRCQRC